MRFVPRRCRRVRSCVNGFIFYFFALIFFKKLLKDGEEYDRVAKGFLFWFIFILFLEPQSRAVAGEAV